MTKAPTVIAYDGACGLCHGFVRFLLRRDKRANLRFAGSDGATGRQLFADYGQDPNDPDAMVTVAHNGTTTGADAAIAAIVALGGAWRLTAALRWVPAGIRNGVYSWVARNRIAWFGRASGCPAPQPEWSERFLP